MNFVLVALCVVCCNAVAVVLLCLVVRSWVRRQRDALVSQLQDWVSPGAGGALSPLAQFTGAVSNQLADALTMRLKTTMMGQASALAKSVDAATGDVAEDMVGSKNPLIAALIGFSPSLRARLRKNPLAAMALSNVNLGAFLGKGSGGGSGPQGPSNGSSQGAFGL